MSFFSSMIWIALSFLFFTVMVAVISAWKTRDDKLDTAEGYFLAGRGLPGIVIAGSLLLTNLSAEQLVGTNGQGWASNMSPIGWEVGALFTLFALALWFLPTYLKMGTTTIPQLMEARFGRGTKLMFSFVIVVMYSILNLPVILYSGAVVFENIFDISGIFGISKFTAVAILCVVIGIIGGCYAIFGGLKAVAVSDTINGIGLIIGGLMIPFLALALLGHETTGGGLAWGSGCSPSLSRDLVFFTDNLDTVSLLALDIHTGAIVASLPVIDELPANMPVSVENSAIVYDHGTGTISTIVCNWFGAGSPNLAKPDNDSSIQSYENIYDRNWLMKGNSMIMPGIERVDTIRTDDGWTMKSVWCRDDLSDTSMMKLSTATGYIYGFVQDVDSGMWQYIVLDFETGKTALTVDVASLYGYNNMAIGMYAGRDGNKLYCPTGYKELLRLQDRFVYLPEMPYRKVDLDKTRRTVVSAAEFAAAGGQGTPATWLHTVTFDNLHPQTIAAIRVNGLTGKASDYKLYAKGTDGQYHAFTGSWSLENASGRLRAQKVYEIRFALQDGGDFDLSTDAKEVTAAILLAR